MFNAYIEELVNSNPVTACVLFTPRWSSILMCVYLFYIATLKLVIALKPYYLMQLNQERVALQLNILAIVLCIVDTGAALLIQGSTCSALAATTDLKVTTGLEFKENALESSSSYVDVLTIFTFTMILLTVVEYAVSEIVANFSIYKVWFSRCRERISYYFCDDIQNNQDTSVLIVLPLENYGQPQTPPLTQFQKMMKLIKGMGFFAGIFLLVAYFLLIFFKLSLIVQLTLSIGGKILLQCTPVYWVLVVDDVYEFTKRRTAPVLTSVYQYFTDSGDNPEKLRSQNRVAKLNRVAVETPRELLPIPRLSTTVLRAADERTEDVLPITGSHITVASEANETLLDILSIPGSSTVPRVADNVHHVPYIVESSMTLPRVEI